MALARGLVFLVSVIDWYSRCVLSWRLSNTIDMSFCIEALEDAFQLGKPEIFNTDQGSLNQQHPVPGCVLRIRLCVLGLEFLEILREVCP